MHCWPDWSPPAAASTAAAMCLPDFGCIQASLRPSATPTYTAKCQLRHACLQKGSSSSRLYAHKALLFLDFFAWLLPRLHASWFALGHAGVVSMIRLDSKQWQPCLLCSRHRGQQLLARSLQLLISIHHWFRLCRKTNMCIQRAARCWQMMVMCNCRTPGNRNSSAGWPCTGV